MAKSQTPQKRQFEDLSGIEPSTAAVHCSIETLSPVKKAKSGINYFDGVLTDGQRKVRIIGFDEKIQEKLFVHHTKNESVILDNCFIKKSRSDDLEILVNKTTSVTQSPKKFDIPPSSLDITEEVNIKDLENIDDGTKVTVRATIVSLAPVRAVSTGRVQDVTISDKSGTSNLSAWEDNVDKLEVGQTYKFTNVYVRSYRGEKSITLSHQSTYELIEDENVSTAIFIDKEELEELEKARIIGCYNFVIHISCVNCSGKLLLDGGNSTSACCSKCNILQLTKGRDFEVSANLLVQGEDGHKVQLKICRENVLKLLPDMDTSQSSTELAEKLLYTPPMRVVYTKKMCYIKDIEIDN